MSKSVLNSRQKALLLIYKPFRAIIARFIAWNWIAYCL